MNMEVTSIYLVQRKWFWFNSRGKKYYKKGLCTIDSMLPSTWEVLVFFFKIYLFIWGVEMGTEGERNPIRLFAEQEPDAGLDPRTLGS